MSATSAHETLRAALAAAARRWRNRRLLEGTCVVAAGTLAVAVLAIAFMDSQRFAPDMVSLARTGVYLLAGALALAFMLARVPWRRDAGALARQLEARDPALDALLLTAVQVHRDGGQSTLSQRLYRRAAAACEDPDGATRDDRAGQRRAARTLAAMAGVVLLALLLAGPAWRHGAMLLALPLADARDGMPYAVLARPGTITVLENSDLAVLGEARGFAPGAMALMHRGEGEPTWQRTPMEAGDDGGFQSLLVGVAAPFEYYLEAQGVRTSSYRVAVQWLPRIEAMQHRYHYPDYTGLGERVVDDATEITAVTGTRVHLRLRPATAPLAGELVLDGAQRRALVADGDVLTASIGVDEASRYRIELATADGALVAVTPEHDIRALADGAPVVTLVSPGADTRVTAVEELRLEVHAEDDVSLRQVELVLSVNGEPEEVVPLQASDAGTVVRALHDLHLEQRALTPGDVIAVHARASDGVAARTAVTDLLFLEVRPFDRDYSRGRSGGRQGGGGGGDAEQGLAAQQRDLVVALFRLARDAARLSAPEQTERLTILSDAQARIRERVEAIVRRIQGRAVVQTAPGYKVMLEEMPRATAAMLRVEALLAVPAAEEALPRAREALAHLQRADAAFREVQVAAQQGGGGRGGRSDNADLSRLFELEMDRFRNRYSEVQRAAPQQREQQLDETISKLEELARRQQQEVDRARQRATRSELAGRGAATQQQLAQELEELLRRLERLTREQSSAAMDAARRALEQAAQAMREAGSPSAGQAQGEAGQQAQGQAQGEQARGQAQGQPSAGQGQPQGGGAAGARGAERAARDALDRLLQAREALASDGPAQVARELEDARQRAESLAQRQEQMRERLTQGAPAAGVGEPDVGHRAPRRGRAPGSGARAQQWRRDGDLPQPPAPDRAAADAASGRGDTGAQASAQGGVRDREGGADTRALDAAKAAMELDAAALREQLDRIAQGAGTEQPEAARRTRSAASIMREEDVEGRLRRSREELAAGVPDPGLENAIGRALDRVRDRVGEAARAAADDAGQGGREAAGAPTAEGLRALMRELAGLRERTRDAMAGSAGPGGWDVPGWQNLAGSLDRLRGSVARNPGASGDLETLIRGIESLAAQGDAIAGGPQRDAFLEALAGVERALAQLAGADAPALPAGRDARAPDRYRALVEDYYRRLSRE